MRPVMIFDGECGFCRHWIRRWQRLTAGRVEYVSYQEAAGRFPRISRSEFERAVQYVEADGTVYAGAAAVFRSLTHVPGRSWLFSLYKAVPLFASASDAAYDYVASHRLIFSRLTRIFYGNETGPATYYVARWFFLRMLAVSYFAAFFSMGTQILGLMGSDGVLPVQELMTRAREYFGGVQFFELPTIFWWNHTDAFLTTVCTGGSILSVLLFLGFLPQICLIGLWLLYLSIASVGREFLGFQWDILLLEAGFLAIFLAPIQWIPRPSREDAPSGAVLWFFWLLLFKLMFSSGVVKLSSGDAAWKSMTALDVHFETQPLPHVLSWYAHQLPGSVKKMLTAGMFGIELILPFLIFLPRRPRLVAASGFILLQIGIIATGNYCFFNLLTIALSLLLIDDASWPRWWAGLLGKKFPIDGHFEAVARPDRPLVIRAVIWLRRGLFAPVAIALALLTPLHIAGAFRWRISWPATLLRLEAAVGPFRSAGGYGLFAVMTPSRPEITIEGSRDGRVWRDYRFKYKPNDVTSRPRWAAPHQPRLDWQMWFAALSGYQQNPWFVNLCVRLLQGSAPVLDLFASNPFPDAPPKYIRAVVSDFRFTDFAARRKEDAWWTSRPAGLYMPVISLRQNDSSPR